jgi:prepilin-type N-terminal cleavage/methylation domain-containing protein/prepilin-type processing-associated H-X9-DG protein
LCRKNVKGFTLIELLVVIAIIAILAAILFPVFAKAREQARSINCLSNMKSIGTALQMYMQDADGFFPGQSWSAVTGAGDNGEIYCGHVGPGNQAQLTYAENCSIRAQLDPYIKNDSIWMCPSDAGTVWGPGKPAYAIGERFTSYHYHYWYAWFVAEMGNSLPENFLSDPARSFVFSEVVPFHDFRPYDSSGWDWYPDCKANLVFGDGHAKATPVSQAYCTDGSSNQYMFDYHWPRRRFALGGDFVPPVQGAENLEDLNP